MDKILAWPAPAYAPAWWSVEEVARRAVASAEWQAAWDAVEAERLAESDKDRAVWRRAQVAKEALR